MAQRCMQYDQGCRRSGCLWVVTNKIFMIVWCAVIALSGMCFTLTSHLSENYDLIMQIITMGSIIDSKYVLLIRGHRHRRVVSSATVRVLCEFRVHRTTTLML